MVHLPNGFDHHSHAVFRRVSPPFPGPPGLTGGDGPGAEGLGHRFHVGGRGVGGAEALDEALADEDRRVVVPGREGEEGEEEGGREGRRNRTWGMASTRRTTYLGEL